MDMRRPITVTGVVTQGRGRNDVQQWVTKYEISHSDDGHIFHPITDIYGYVVVGGPKITIVSDAEGKGADEFFFMTSYDEAILPD